MLVRKKYEHWLRETNGLSINHQFYAHLPHYLIMNRGRGLKRVSEESLEAISLVSPVTGATRKNMMSVSGAKVKIPDITFEDFVHSLASCPPSVNDSDMTKLQDFNKKFGHQPRYDAQQSL